MNGRSHPFVLVPWQDDFTSRLLELALERGGGLLGRSLFVFPHARPAKYLERKIALSPDIPKPCIMPGMMPVSSLFQKISAMRYSPKSQIGLLDRVGLLMRCVRDEQREVPGAIGALPASDARSFFPWGARLADLFEECFLHLRRPENFLYLEDSVAEYAALLLGRLSSLYRRYAEALEREGMTTPGFTALKAAEFVAENPDEAMAMLDGSDIYIAGFHSLSGSQDFVFRRLWAAGRATVVAHADPALAESTDKAHWCCAALEAWRKDWKSDFVLLGESGMAAQSGRDILYYEGYDAHSQLSTLESLLKESTDSAEDTAIILPDTDMLLPALHHIPTGDLNISMGYPLFRSPLNRLLESVAALQENKRGGYYWKDMIALVRHPYVKMLDSGAATGGKPSTGWRVFLQKLETALREGDKYVDAGPLLRQTLLALEGDDAQESLAELLKAFEFSCVTVWENIGSLKDLARALSELCSIMLERGSSLWPRFPIDAECIYRFMQSIIPQLSHSMLADEEFPPGVLYAILRELIRAERVPFDAEPLTALQIMGLLESRLLSFKRVFVLNATDDLVPGSPAHDPLMPDALRRELGLPHSRRRQEQSAYYFFRLLAASREVHLFWQEGVESRGLQDEKKLKSRFIEELLWKEEQNLGRLLEPRREDALSSKGETRADSAAGLKDGPLTVISCPMSPVNTRRKTLLRSPEMQRALEDLLSRPLSATCVNSFLRCPLSFYYREIARLNPLPDADEDDSPRQVGTLLHDVLKQYYQDKLGRELRREELDKSGLVRLFETGLASEKAFSNVPPDVLASIAVAVPSRIESYIDRQPESTVVHALEAEAKADLDLPGLGLFRLKGALDRVDERPLDDGRNALVILDYKTGRINKPDEGLWGDQAYWNALHNLKDAGGGEARELFELTAERLRDIQLPFYLYLARNGVLQRYGQGVNPLYDRGLKAVNSAWVALAEDGRERYLFAEDDAEEMAVTLDVKIPELMRFILAYMIKAADFAPREGRHCSYCDYAKICLVLTGK